MLVSYSRNRVPSGVNLPRDGNPAQIELLESALLRFANFLQAKSAILLEDDLPKYVMTAIFDFGVMKRGDPLVASSSAISKTDRFPLAVSIAGCKLRQYLRRFSRPIMPWKLLPTCNKYNGKMADLEI